MHPCLPKQPTWCATGVVHEVRLKPASVPSSESGSNCLTSCRHASFSLATRRLAASTLRRFRSCSFSCSASTAAFFSSRTLCDSSARWRLSVAAACRMHSSSCSRSTSIRACSKVCIRHGGRAEGPGVGSVACDEVYQRKSLKYRRILFPPGVRIRCIASSGRKHPVSATTGVQLVGRTPAQNICARVFMVSYLPNQYVQQRLDLPL